MDVNIVFSNNKWSSRRLLGKCQNLSMLLGRNTPHDRKQFWPPVDPTSSLLFSSSAAKRRIDAVTAHRSYWSLVSTFSKTYLVELLNLLRLVHFIGEQGSSDAVRSHGRGSDSRVTRILANEGVTSCSSIIDRRSTVSPSLLRKKTDRLSNRRSTLYAQCKERAKHNARGEK